MPGIIRMKVRGRRLRIKDCAGWASLRGLMFDSMEDCDGALIYGRAVWMPFVRHRLELHFLDSRKKTVEIQHAVPISLHPRTWKIYRNEKASYVLEIKRR
jgi:uncharacterized membrane protein (UPF0127 family)